MKRIAIFCMIVTTLIILNCSSASASLTKEQSDDVAEFASTFISEGNARRDSNGYPLLVYALSNNGNTCVEIRRSGYYSELYHVKNNNYHKLNGKYLDLGYKWTMDCGDFIAYVYYQTLGLDMINHSNEDPWHIKDMYADANKYGNSKYFEFIYKNVPISSIKEEKLEKGDVILYFGPRDNHGLVYVGEGMMAAHASRNAIKYSKNPPILGFDIVAFNRFYKTSTVVSIVRIKDGVVPKDAIVNSKITWPDNGEEQILTERYKEYLDALEKSKEEVLETEEIDENVLESSVIDDTSMEYLESNSIELDAKSIVLFIEEEMYSWMTDGVKKFYAEAEKQA